MTKETKGLSSKIERSVSTAAEEATTASRASAAASPTPLAKQIEKTTKTRQKSYLMDLRIHSPISMGYLSVGGIDTAPALVRLARVKGLDVIAVTDFYSGAFVDRVAESARDTDLTVIPGTVIRCKVGMCDDVVLTCLFPEGTDSAQIAAFLRELDVPLTTAGDRRFLVKHSIETIIATIERYNGLAMPSRLDKTPMRQSAIPVLVQEYGFRAFDLAYPDSARYFKQHWPKTKFNLFCFSNAHALAQIGSRSARVKMPESGFAGLRTMFERQLEQ